MAEKIRKHTGKIFIFFINLFLMMIAIFVIKDKDQARRSSETQKNLLDENSTLKVELQSLRGVLNKINSALSVEEVNVSADEKNQSASKPNTAVTPLAGTENSAPAAASSPAPDPTSKPSNAKTKTS